MHGPRPLHTSHILSQFHRSGFIIGGFNASTTSSYLPAAAQTSFNFVSPEELGEGYFQFRGYALEALGLDTIKNFRI